MPSWTQRLLGRTPPEPHASGTIWSNALLLAGPPASVVTVLWAYQSVPAAFLVYHVAWCLLVPLALSLAKGRSLAEHRAAIGLRHGDDRRALGTGALVGLAMFVGIFPLFLALGDALLGQADLAGQLATWHVPQAAAPALFVYMLIFNSGAEELYWRGFLHERLSTWKSRWLAIGTASAVFASYHYYTLASLVADTLVATLLTAGVFVGAVTWAVLRERYDSVYPAVLAHVGATAGYMSIYVLWI